jgi:hypothetical protein
LRRPPRGLLALTATLVLFAGAASAQSDAGPPAAESEDDRGQAIAPDERDGFATATSPSEPQAPTREDQPASVGFTSHPLTTHGYARASGTYFAENSSSPLDPIAGLGSRGLGRLIANIKPEYTPFGERRLTIAADALGLVSKLDGNVVERDSFDFFLLESYADLQTGAYRFSAGKRNAVRSAGYFRYPLDFYDTPSLVTTGAEDPRRVLETRIAPLLASAERRWSWGSASVEYLPKLSGNALFQWHTNQQQQIIGRYGFVRGGAGVNVAIQRMFERDGGRDVDGNPFRAREVTEIGASSTYVIGSSLELHAEASFRRDQRLPHAATREFRLETPNGTVVPLPVWSAGAKGSLVEALVGGQYTFGDRTFLEGWNVILEYEYQNEGWTNGQWDSFFDQVSRLQRFTAPTGVAAPIQSQIQPVVGEFGRRTGDLLAARPAFWGRHYGFLRVSRTDFLITGLEVAAYTVPSLQDSSFVAGGNLAYEPQGGFQLRLDARVLGGPGKSEFGRSPDRTLVQFEVGYGF